MLTAVSRRRIRGERSGRVRPHIFSTTPRTGSFVILQKLSSFRTSAIATSCGVVTTTAPSIVDVLRYCTIEMCSSEVPGGVSMMR